MAPAKPTVALRPMLPTDGEVLAALFRASIEDLTADDYSPAQQAAWSEAADDEEAFAKRLSSLLTLVATIGGEPVGFGSLAVPDHIEMLYVAPAAAGNGVGAALCEALERFARARGAKAVTVDASDTAESFFAKRGFKARQRSTVARGDEWLGRTSMTKTIEAPPESQH